MSRYPLIIIFICLQEVYMARPNLLNDSVVISTRIEREMDQMLSDIAALETISTGRKVTKQELMRNAINFVYSDNERLRECFRRSRSHISKRFK